MASASRYTPAQRAEAERLLRGTGLSLRAVGARLGIPPATLRTWSRRAGWRAPQALPAGGLDAAGAADGETLRAALRSHIARQIAAFDAALREDGGGIDSARVLRDLGGLKRLLDELTATREEGDAGTPAAEPDDLPALRAEIARRLGLAGVGGCPVEPARPAAAGDGP